MMNKMRIAEAFKRANSDYNINNVVAIEKVSQNEYNIAAGLSGTGVFTSEYQLETPNGIYEHVDFSYHSDIILSQVFEAQNDGSFVSTGVCDDQRFKVYNIKPLNNAVITEKDVDKHFDRYPELHEEIRDGILEAIMFNDFRVPVE